MQRHYLRLLAKQAATEQETAELIRKTFLDLNILYETEAHPKGGFRVFFSSPGVDDGVLEALERNGLMQVF